ncbi:protein kinase [Streptomyces sp. NPDC004111]|uniref:serine/threonine-protein kinase n=1 Tax=Streptomyces sp. NPDC004111 TaxID=3364690 RepID=UPI0036CC43E8
MSGDGAFEPLKEQDPRVVGRYRLVARLGAGGMGDVFLSHTPGGRAVALKVIKPHLTGDAEFRRRFRQEVRAARQVAALHTAPVIDAETEGETPWLATAFVPGPSLAEAVDAHGPLPVDSVLLLVAGVAEALQAIHACGIVHRDLKPSNVLLAADGPRVIDFGIAHAAGGASITATGIAVGTPAFMSPEQAEGRQIGPETDVFSLGLIASHASTGDPAFGDGTPHGVLYRIIHAEPNLAGVPPRLHDLISRCLAKNPADRPTTDQVIGLCRAAAGGTGLRRAEDWLPPALSAAISARPAAPEAGPATPGPYAHGSPASGSPAYGSPAYGSPAPGPSAYGSPAAPHTPPGVFGPPQSAGTPAGHPPRAAPGAVPPPSPYAPGQPQPYAPQQPQPYASYACPQPYSSAEETPAFGSGRGAGAGPGAGTGGAPAGRGARPRPRRTRVLGAVAAVLVAGGAGAGAVHLLGNQDAPPPDGRQEQTRQPGGQTPLPQPPPATYPPGPDSSSVPPEVLDTRKKGTPAPPLKVPPSARNATPDEAKSP